MEHQKPTNMLSTRISFSLSYTGKRFRRDLKSHLKYGSECVNLAKIDCLLARITAAASRWTKAAMAWVMMEACSRDTAFENEEIGCFMIISLHQDSG